MFGMGLIQCQANWDVLSQTEEKAISEDVKDQILPVFVIAFAISLVVQFLSSLPLVTGLGSAVTLVPGKIMIICYRRQPSFHD